VKLFGFLDNLQQTFEIIVSDDGSTDETKHLNWCFYYNNFNTKYIRSNVNVGKGSALRRGLQISKGKFVFFTDADLPIELDALHKGIELLKKGDLDIVIGNRYLPDSKVIGSSSFIRNILSKLFNIFVKTTVLSQYSDTQCCLKGFTLEALKTILPFCSINSYAVDVELLRIAKRQNLKVGIIPVNWKDNRSNFGFFKILYLSIFLIKDIVCIAMMSAIVQRLKIIRPLKINLKSN
jgi:dolichyl-phosphate beta-glucosyltransferase